MASQPEDEIMTQDECLEALRECRKANQRLSRIERELERLREALEGQLPPRPN